MNDRIRWGRLALVAVTLLAAACGRKAMPKPPEDVVPATITDLSATMAPEGVTLTWNRPKGYVDGSRMNDLGGFVIERADGTDPDEEFQELGRVIVTDRERFQQERRFRLTDASTIVGASYRYRVVSFTVDEYFSTPSNVVIVGAQTKPEETHAPLPETPR